MDVYSEDSQYLRWLADQNPDFKIDWDKLSKNEEGQGICDIDFIQAK